MIKPALAIFGLVVLALAAAGAYRALSSGGGAGSASTSDLAGGGGAPRIKRAETPRPLPELHFVDGTGARHSLADFRGRVILLNVWATWCVPCREEMPALDRLQAALGGPDFEVVPLSIDRGGVSAVRSFYGELELRALRIYVDASGEALTKLGAVGIPLTLLVDRDGRELWRVVGPAEWDKPAAVNRIRSHLPEAPKHRAPDG